MFLKIIKRSYSTLVKGEGKEQRIFLLDKQGNPISFWHDIPLQNSPSDKDIFNIGIEIPRHRLSKMEVTLNELHNPIKQDTRINQYTNTNELRMYGQFPFFQYGFFPQTWENPQQKVNKRLEGLEGIEGDNDPLDVVELGSAQYKVGQVEEVKVLGSLCLIDQGEIDWKVFTMNVREAREGNIDTIEDVQQMQPGRIKAIMDWFVNIKTFDGKAKNTIYKEKLFSKEETLEVIAENHQEYLENRSEFI